MSSSAKISVSYTPEGSGGVTTPLEEFLRELGENPVWRGALSDGSNASTAFQSSIDTNNLNQRWFGGTFSTAGLVANRSSMRFQGIGAVILSKRSDTPIVTVPNAANGSGANSNQEVEFRFVSFYGDAAFTSPNISSLSYNHLKLFFCGSRNGTVRATGNRTEIIGTTDVYYVNDPGATLFDIDLGDLATVTTSHKIALISTTQGPEGGIKVRNTGATLILGNQFGKLYADAGSGGPGSHGPIVAINRINGDQTILQSNTILVANSCSEDLVIGDGTTGFSGIILDGSHVIDSGKTATVKNKVIDSYLDVRHLRKRNVAVTLESEVRASNLVVDGLQNYTPSFKSSTGSNPTLGTGGTIAGWFTQNGDEITMGGRIIFGTGATFGSNVWRIGIPEEAEMQAAGAGRRYHGTAALTERPATSTPPW